MILARGPLPAPKGSAELLVSWLLSGEEEQFEFHMSICAEPISPTSAGRSGWMRCILQCASDGRVWSPVRRPDKKSMVNALATQVL